MFAATALVACGGGGAANGTSATSAFPAPYPSTSAAGMTSIAGTVSLTLPDAYGPVTVGAATYASADARTLAPLAHAAIVIGPVPVTGATPPAIVPSGDVVTLSDEAGAFSAIVAVPPSAPSSSEPFVIPANNITAFVPPTAGYYVEVFGDRTDGTSAGVPIPLHRFLAASTSIALRVSSVTAAEASALTAVNADRAATGAPPLIFDQSAEEAARLHASDESAAGYTCHYDTKNVGPSSRYAASGGMGLTGEALALAVGVDAATAFQVVESAFIAERLQKPPGGHALNVLDPSHVWIGVAASTSEATTQLFNVDYEMITPSANSLVVGSSAYEVSMGCPAKTTNNES